MRTSPKRVAIALAICVGVALLTVGLTSGGSVLEVPDIIYECIGIILITIGFLILRSGDVDGPERPLDKIRKRLRDWDDLP